MFKLDGMDVKDRTQSRPASRQKGGYGSTGGTKHMAQQDDADCIQVVNWDEQALKSAEGKFRRRDYFLTCFTAGVLVASKMDSLLTLFVFVFSFLVLLFLVGLSKGKGFRSAAVYAEVKLAEALNKRTLEKKLNGEDDTEGNPDMYRTAFCIHLLGELVGLSGPFGKVLSTIRDECCKAIYSEYYAAQKEDLIFEQQTFFSALEHVEQEKDELLEEREQFRQLLLERESEIDGIDKSIKELTKSLQQEKNEKLELQRAYDKTKKELGNRTAEFRLCVDDLKLARQSMIRTSDELKELRSRHTEKLKQISDLTNEVSALRSQLNSVVKEKDQIKIASAGSASKKELELAKQTIEELEIRIATISGTDNYSVARSLTPRPDWKKLKPFENVEEIEITSEIKSIGDGSQLKLKKKESQLKLEAPFKMSSSRVPGGAIKAPVQTSDPESKSDGSTVSIAEEVVKRMKKSLVDLSVAQKDVDLLRHQKRNAFNFLSADPDASTFAAAIREQLLELNDNGGEKGSGDGKEDDKEVSDSEKTPDKSSGDRGDGDGDQDDEKVVILPALKLLKELSREDATERTIKEHELEPFGAASTIPRFLRYTKKIKLTLLSKEVTKGMISSIWSSKDEFDGLRTRSTTLCEYIFVFLLERYGNNLDMIAEQGYQLFLSAHCYDDDGEVLMFKKVLYGEISEECHFDFECLMAGLMQEISSLLEGQGTGGGDDDQEQTVVKRSDLFGIMDRFFPNMAKEDLQKIKDALVKEEKKEEFDFMPLFDVDSGEVGAPTKNQNRGVFLGAIMLQYVNDLSSYSNKLKTELAKVEKDENGFAKLSDIKDVIRRCDSKKSEDDLFLDLTRGAHLNSVADVKWYMSLGEEVEINEFIKNLTHKLLRASKYYVMSSMSNSANEAGGDGDEHAGGSTFMTDGGDWSTAQPSLA